MRLCGGEALMAISAVDLDIDIMKTADVFENKGCDIKQKEEMMMVMQWNGMETTVYPQGKVMFFPLKDRSLCIKYASEILGECVLILP